jgi:hypothetical protein
MTAAPYGAKDSSPGRANFMHEPAPEGRETIAHGASRGEKSREFKSPGGAEEVPELQVRLWRGLSALAHKVREPGVFLT